MSVFLSVTLSGDPTYLTCCTSLENLATLRTQALRKTSLLQMSLHHLYTAQRGEGVEGGSTATEVVAAIGGGIRGRGQFNIATNAQAGVVGAESTGAKRSRLGDGAGYVHETAVTG